MDIISGKARSMRGRLPSAPEMPDISLPERPALSLPRLPRRAALDFRKRVSHDTSGDSPMLSLAGGLLLGLIVGTIVAVILISRSEEDGGAIARHTRISLLPSGGADRHADNESAAETG